MISICYLNDLELFLPNLVGSCQFSRCMLKNNVLKKEHLRFASFVKKFQVMNISSWDTLNVENNFRLLLSSSYLFLGILQSSDK